MSSVVRPTHHHVGLTTDHFGPFSPLYLVLAVLNAFDAYHEQLVVFCRIIH